VGKDDKTFAGMAQLFEVQSYIISDYAIKGFGQKDFGEFAKLTPVFILPRKATPIAAQFSINKIERFH
jgi:hypothetical protein